MLSCLIAFSCSQTTISSEETIYAKLDMKQINQADQMLLPMQDQMTFPMQDQMLLPMQDQMTSPVQDQMLLPMQDQMMSPMQDQMIPQENQSCIEACQSINNDCLSSCQNNQIDQVQLSSACLQACNPNLAAQMTHYTCDQKIGILSTLSGDFQQQCQPSPLSNCLFLCLDASTCMDDLCTTPLNDTHLLVNHCNSACENNPSILTDYFTCESRVHAFNLFDPLFNNLCAPPKVQPANDIDACMQFAQCAQDQCLYYRNANLFALASTCLAIYRDSDLYETSNLTCEAQVQYMSNLYANFSSRCDQMMNGGGTELTVCQTECELLDLCADRYCSNRSNTFYDDCVESCSLTPTFSEDLSNLSNLLTCEEKISSFNIAQPSYRLTCDFSGFVIGPGRPLSD
jgi:hypothetical protein